MKVSSPGRAAVSLPAIGAGVVGLAASALAGLPLAGAVIIGGLGWAGGAGIALLRRPRPPRIDPFAVGDRWRGFVRHALQAQARYRSSIATVRPGPLRDRLEELGRRIDQGVDECWQVAQHGHQLEQALSRVDDAHDANSRLRALATESEARLRVLEGRLTDAATRAVELSLRAHAGPELKAITNDVAHVVDDLEALRQGLEEAGGTSP